MARPGWLNDNEYRNFPFIPQELLAIAPSGELLPPELIVDAGFIMGLEAEFEDTQDYIYLYEIRRGETVLEIELRTTAAGALDHALVFTRALDAAEWETEYVEPVLISVSSSSSSSAGSIGAETCGETPRWEGFLITGKLDAILLQLPTAGDKVTYTAGEWQTEPGLIQNLRKAFLQSVGLANVYRARWSPDTECGGAAPGALPIYVNQACLDGNLRWKEGYNCTIRQEDTSNTIIIGALVGAGEGLACSEVPLYDGEAPPEDSNTLSGGPRCTEVLKTINGVGGRVIRLYGGQGIQVTTDEESPHTVIVTVSLQGFAYCPKDT